MSNSIGDWYLNGQDASTEDSFDDEYVEAQDPWDHAESEQE
ncbi:hypothetical protein AAIH32_12030 [Pseudarthrobacter oxydans]|jgi:hypothetical protein